MKKESEEADNVVIKALEVLWLRAVKEVRWLETMLEEARNAQNQDIDENETHASKKPDDSSHCCVDLHRATGSGSR